MNCIHDLVEQICINTGVDYSYLKEYKTLKDAIAENRSYNVKVVVKSIHYNWPQKRQIKGGQWILDSDGRLFPLDFKFDSIYAERKRTFQEVDPLGVAKAGKYRDSLKGGWYQTVDLYTYKGKQYADMDCNCF